MSRAVAQPWKLRGYVIERLLGVGGTGEVWRARVAATGEAVALKRIAQSDSYQIRRIHSEAALLSALEHPNLIRLHAVLEDADSYVLVLDLADGGSLANLLVARERLTPGEVVTALAPVAAALAYAHEQGVVHGDVSPANVLFTAGGVALLADLGVARLCGDDAEAESTPGYLDPAVAVGCVPSPASDVFMLGGVALHALTGQPTWPGRNAADLLTAARAGVLPDVPQRLADAHVPEPMAAVITRALASDALARGSAAEFALDLRESAAPVAVELHAVRSPLQRRDAIARGAREAVASGSGRGGRHAAVILPERERASTRLPWRTLAADDVVPNSLPPTTSVQPRSRPQLPSRRRAAPVPRRVGWGVALVAVLALAALGARWLVSGPHATPAEPDHQVAAVLPPAASSVAADSNPARSPASLAPSSIEARPDVATSGPPATNWAAVLRALDGIRARAFATRDPTLLAEVYASTALRRQDARSLARLVPRGCVLAGARTRYTAVRTVPDDKASAGDGVLLAARAALHASTLRCRGRPRAVTPATRPVSVRILVVRTRAGPRIRREWLR
jgi:eukaryotic-like serine/threonine-protein kinase